MLLGVMEASIDGVTEPGGHRAAVFVFSRDLPRLSFTYVDRKGRNEGRWVGYC